MSFDIFISSLFGSLGQGLLFALIAIGIFLNLRIMKTPDLTVEGSFAFGGVIAMTMLSNGAHFMTALLVAPLGGAVAGLATGLIHTKLRIDGIISGLLVTMALFSINLFVMGSPIISAPMETFVSMPFRVLLDSLGVGLSTGRLLSWIFVGLIVTTIVIAGLYLLFKTSFGLSVRATGSNEYMARSNGINTDACKIFTLMLSNTIVALGGAIIMQQQGGADVNRGIGVLVIGLAALVIGEVMTPKKASILTRLLFIVIGAVLYFKVINIIIISGLMGSEATRLLTAVLTLLALCAPRLRQIRFRRANNDQAK